MVSPAQAALKRLRSGNRRFVEGKGRYGALSGETRRLSLVAGQSPFAAVIGCSDSRVVPEIIFDHALGDLFVARVAGNVATPETIASVEYAVERFGTRLAVVLGHSWCGAVTAALETLHQPADELTSNLTTLLNRIRPAVASLGGKRGELHKAEVLDQAVRANVRANVRALLENSSLLAQAVEDDGLKIAGAQYSLETGEVEFL